MLAAQKDGAVSSRGEASKRGVGGEGRGDEGDQGNGDDGGDGGGDDGGDGSDVLNVEGAGPSPVAARCRAMAREVCLELSAVGKATDAECIAAR